MSSELETRSRLNNEKLLAALIERRAELARTASNAEAKRAALQFLDERIAEVRRRIGPRGSD